MRRRSFRGRRRATWIWADNGVVNKTITGPGDFFLGAPLLPSNRVEWLLDNRAGGKSTLTTRRILLWLYTSWTNTTESNTLEMPDIDLYIIKTASDDQNGADIVFHPFQQPLPPANTGSAWYGTGSVAEEDGLDPFLWCGHLPGMDSVMGPGTSLTYPSPWTSYGNLGSSGLSHLYSSSDAGYGTYHPTHDLSVKRRMAHNEGILLAARVPSATGALNTGMALTLSWHTRILA